MARSQPTGDTVEDDEFSALPENAAEAGVPEDRIPRVRRIEAQTLAGRLSALRWGNGAPRVLLLHGGGQNAHTWDTLLLALGVPALAVDLPGHGRSAWRPDRDYSPATNAATVAAALGSWGIRAVPVVGMSLGGLTGIALAARHPEAVSALVVVDVTPGVLVRTAAMTVRQRGTTALVTGPAEFDDLEAMVEAAAAGAPQRSRASLRRGVLHNARRLPDGRWTWRYDRPTPSSPEAFTRLWDDVARIDVPVTLVRGGDSAFVAPEDVAEFEARRPGLVVEVVPGAGHAVQSDRPRELAALLELLLRP